MTSKKPANLTIVEPIEPVIRPIRRQKVILDIDLARIYGVETRGLIQAVKRNIERFPDDFMFQLTMEEADALRFQIGSLKRGLHFKYLPYVFTQEGVAMLSGVLNSPRAEQVNIAIMRAFVRLRETLALHKDLAQKLADLERKVENQDESIQTLFEAIRQLMSPPDTPRKEIGFHVKEPAARNRVTPSRKNGQSTHP